MMESPLTPEELKLYRQLRARYLDITCRYCHSQEVEDRNIITCTGCGVVIADFTTMKRDDEQKRIAS